MDVKRAVTNEQKEAVLSVPDVFEKKENYYFDEEDTAILNNVPGNSEIEEMNHLNELEAVCQNWKDTEWKRVLYYAPHTLITEEIERRFKADDEVISSIKTLDTFLVQVKR